MNLEEFLAKGYRLVKGDIVDDFGECEVFSPEVWNKPCEDDYNIIVVKAKALEDQPKQCGECKTLTNRIKELEEEFEKEVKELTQTIEYLQTRW